MCCYVYMCLPSREYLHVYMYVNICACVPVCWNGQFAQGNMEGIKTNWGLQWAWGAIGRAAFWVLCWYDQLKKAAQGLRR